MEQACLSAEKTGKNISSVAGVDANSVRSVKTVNVHRGDIYYADLSPVVGSEQGGVRPVLIVQNDVGNRFSPTVIAAAITSQRDKTNLPTHIALHAERTGLQRIHCALNGSAPMISTVKKKKWASSMATPCSASTKPSVSASAFTIHISKGRKKPTPFEKLRAARFAFLFVFLRVPFKVQKQGFSHSEAGRTAQRLKSLFEASPIALP